MASSDLRYFVNKYLETHKEEEIKEDLIDLLEVECSLLDIRMIYSENHNSSQHYLDFIKNNTCVMYLNYYTHFPNAVLYYRDYEDGRSSYINGIEETLKEIRSGVHKPKG